METNITEGLVRDLDLTLQPRPAPRYKVWLPLATQQLRLRSLYQIIGFNLEADKNFETCWFYFTLHRSSMSSPLYTSEPIDNVNPKWASLEVPTLHATGLATANEIVLRLWRRIVANDPTTDVTVFTWGISFTGLVYMGPKLLNNLDSILHHNSLIFHLHGGFFVPSYCLLHPPEFRRYLYMSVNNSDISESYTVNKLSNLRNLMQSLKQRTESVQALRERIASGGSLQSPKYKQTTLNRLLQPKRISKEKKAEILKIRKELEVAKFRTKLLEQERIKKVGELRTLNQIHLSIMEENQDLISLQMERYRELNKDIERLREWRQNHIQIRDYYVQTLDELANLRRQFISDLNIIFPIRQENEKKFTINNVHLPDSEALDAANDLHTSIALGYVAQATQMIANILNVPTRYPMILYGSKSKIVDHVSDSIPDKERQLPLFSRSNHKLQFHYGVYLLNKNIAQLRWYCGLSAVDLRPTLPNLASLLNMKPNQSLDNSKRTFSGSSLDTDNSNGKSNVPSTPPLQKILADRELKLHRSTRSISQFRSSKTTLGSSLDQGLDRPTQILVLGLQTKRICKSEESAIDNKMFSLFRDRLSDSNEENYFNDRKSANRERFKASSSSSPGTIETDIEITVPTSVCMTTTEDPARQRSSNSISSCEMALSGSQNDVDNFRISPNKATSTNGECTSLAESSDPSLIRSVNSLVDNESILSSESLSTSAFEKTDRERSQETLIYLEDRKEVNGSSKSDELTSNETLSSSVVSLDDTRNLSDRVADNQEIASSCPVNAESFYSDSKSVITRNWRTGSNPSLKTSTGYDHEMKKMVKLVPTSQSQPSGVQELINDFQTSSELIDSIRRSSENVFARTEALASKTSSFKVMKPRS
ncbi:UV radiation resistance-associated gene protein [Chelonus insularis]|uniref:UV radiation resistance-associated gene protein n=1 Tax=Chelonus insularis TaxID=460826 RepID=UPI0015886965|nr:UV radiation resistance-associated gene protein [Chelonus insularis]